MIIFLSLALKSAINLKKNIGNVTVKVLLNTSIRYLLFQLQN